MGLDRESLVLLSISLAKDYAGEGIEYKRSHIAAALDISEVTLQRTYISRLKSKQYLDVEKKVYSVDDLKNIDITEEGKKRLNGIWSDLEEMTFSPDRHGIDTYVKVPQILKLINNPLDRIFLLNLYSRVRSFDLLNLLESFQIKNSELSSMNVVKSLESGGKKAFVHYYYDTSLLSIKEIKPSVLDDLLDGRVDLLLLRADAYRRQSKLDKAQEIYEHIIKNPLHCDDNQLFISKVGLANILRIKGNVDESFGILDEIIEKSDNRYFVAYAKEIKAYTYTQMDEYSKGLKLFKSSLTAFRHFGFPLLLAIGFNNRGILHFKMEDYERAKEDWFMAKKYAKESDSPYLEACAMTNQADIHMKRGDLRKAKKLLDKSEAIFRSLSDYYSIASIYFNRALFHLEEGEFQKAVEVFKESEETHPLIPSPLDKKERREEFIKRAEEKGYEDVEKFLNPSSSTTS